MLDLKFVLSNVDVVRQNCVHRNVPEDVLDDFDRVIELESQRKGVLLEVEAVRRRQNEIAQATIDTVYGRIGFVRKA